MERKQNMNISKFVVDCNYKFRDFSLFNESSYAWLSLEEFFGTKQNDNRPIKSNITIFTEDEKFNDFFRRFFRNIDIIELFSEVKEGKRKKKNQKINARITIQQLKAISQLIVENIDLVYKNETQNDLLIRDRLVDFFNIFHNNERVYLFFFLIINYAEFENKEGKEELRENIEFLDLKSVNEGFRFFLNKNGLTRTALYMNVATNMASELQQTSEENRSEIEYLKSEIVRVKSEYEEYVNNSEFLLLKKILIKLNEKSSSLDKMMNILEKLNLKEKTEQLTDEEMVIINFIEDFISSFNELQVNYQPKTLGEIYQITRDKIGKQFHYLEGASFSSEEEVKSVVAKQHGWTIKDEFIIPIRVVEENKQ